MPFARRNVRQEGGMNRFHTLLLVACLCLAGGTAHAQHAESPFEGQLLRLSEILGALHFLRNLCGEEGDDWRAQMEQLLEAENPDGDRRARLIARFNHGYRSFEGTYVSCTESAIAAISLYMREGAELTRDTANRYGN
jgi:uncharacterized protein (TIGR02301 family)